MTTAISSLAAKIGASVITQIKEFGGNMQNVTIGLKLPTLPNGIGFDVNVHGDVIVHGDSYNFRGEFNRVQKLAENYIKALKVAQRAKQLNPANQVRMDVREREVILEVATP